MPRAGAEGGLLLATDAGFAALDAAGGFEPLAGPQAPPARWFMNDGRCDALGRFWVGTVGLADDGRAARGEGSLQRLDPDGSVTLAWSGATLANGMDWSPDARTLYFVDSATGGIDAFPYDAPSGTLGRPRRAIEIGLEMAAGFADGMCVDADGAIWTAVWGVGEVRRYTPDGRLDRTLRLPVSQPTSCAFAGEQLDVLAITSAWHGLGPAARAAEPHAGGVFCWRPGVRGRESHVFG
jgi:sugar lactone lactonase YvrE